MRECAVNQDGQEFIGVVFFRQRTFLECRLKCLTSVSEDICGDPGPNSSNNTR